MSTPEAFSMDQLSQFVLVIKNEYIDDHGDSDYRRETEMSFFSLSPKFCVFEGNELVGYKYGEVTLPISKDRKFNEVSNSVDWISDYHSIKDSTYAFVDVVASDDCYYLNNKLVYCNPEKQGCCTPQNKFSEIKKYAFKDCTKIKQIILPEGVCFIDRWAFYGCIALETINIPSSVYYLGHDAFEGCTNLRNVDLSQNTKIPIDRFSGTPFYVSNT